MRGGCPLAAQNQIVMYRGYPESEKITRLRFGRLSWQLQYKTNIQDRLTTMSRDRCSGNFISKIEFATRFLSI